jgi:phosphatidate phosphatase APP1
MAREPQLFFHNTYKFGSKICSEGIIVLTKPGNAWDHFIKNMLKSYYKLKAFKNKDFDLVAGEAYKKVKTDKRGYFLAIIEDGEGLKDDIRLKIHHGGKKFKLNIPTEEIRDFSSSDTVLISDVDDTLLISKTYRKWLTVFYALKSVLNRRPVHNMLDVYRLFQQKGIPTVYLSSSEFNLGYVLKKFLDLNGFPDGLLLLSQLRNLRGIMKQRSDENIGKYKLKRLRSIVELLQGCNFILLGDNGQKDASIYAQIAHLYPERVKHIYIREVVSKKINKTRKLLSESRHDYTVFKDGDDLLRSVKVHLG